jgi:hypothetical protein
MLQRSIMFHVTQHLSSGRHLKNLKSNEVQPLLKTFVSDANKKSGPSKSEFCLKLCEAFVAANIPLKKLNNPVLKEFLATTTKEIIPDESTLRKNYLHMCYESVSDNFFVKICFLLG